MDKKELIDSIDHNVWSMIFGYLSNKDLLQFSLASKKAMSLVFFFLQNDIKRLPLPAGIYEIKNETCISDIKFTLFYPSSTEYNNNNNIGLWKKLEREDALFKLYYSSEKAFQERNANTVYKVEIPFLKIRNNTTATEPIIYNNKILSHEISTIQNRDGEEKKHKKLSK